MYTLITMWLNFFAELSFKEDSMVTHFENVKFSSNGHRRKLEPLGLFTGDYKEKRLGIIKMYDMNHDFDYAFEVDAADAIYNGVQSTNIGSVLNSGSLMYGKKDNRDVYYKQKTQIGQNDKTNFRTHNDLVWQETPIRYNDNVNVSIHNDLVWLETPIRYNDKINFTTDNDLVWLKNQGQRPPVRYIDKVNFNTHNEKSRIKSQKQKTQIRYKDKVNFNALSRIKSQEQTDQIRYNDTVNLNDLFRIKSQEQTDQIRYKDKVNFNPLSRIKNQEQKTQIRYNDKVNFNALSRIKNQEQKTQIRYNDKVNFNDSFRIKSQKQKTQIKYKDKVNFNDSFRLKSQEQKTQIRYKVNFNALSRIKSQEQKTHVRYSDKVNSNYLSLINNQEQQTQIRYNDRVNFNIHNDLSWLKSHEQESPVRYKVNFNIHNDSSWLKSQTPGNNGVLGKSVWAKVGFREFQSYECSSAAKSPEQDSGDFLTVARVQPSDFIRETADCQVFRESFGFSRYPDVSQEEKNFPLAFIVLFHTDLDQVIFLLRALYRPHNVYCLTPDNKAGKGFIEATRAVAQCLPNVFIATKLVNVVYAGFSRLMADIYCFEDLLQHPVKWTYVLNGSGQQFPLRTNLELVKILQLYNGTNDILGLTGELVNHVRYQMRFTYVQVDTSDECEMISSPDCGKVSVIPTFQKNSPIPYNLQPVKCSAYVSLSRAFVDFVLNSPVAKNLLEWSKSVYSPDELYWGTLNYNEFVPAPGGFQGVPRENVWLTTFTSWGSDEVRCGKGKYVRATCIFSIDDLAMLETKPNFFANKFYMTYQPVVLHCLDQILYKRTLSGETINMSQYEHIDFYKRINHKAKLPPYKI